MELEESKFGILTLRFILIHTVLPILIGGLIYTFWRKPTLLVFSWYDFVGLGEHIIWWRSNTQFFYSFLPDWVLFCLPDGLWVYAVTAFMAGLWINASRGYFLFWVSIGPSLAIGGEIGQLLGFIQGTYDFMDVLFYLVGFIVAVLVVIERSKKADHEKYYLA